jgi:hypothetical protein
MTAPAPMDHHEKMRMRSAAFRAAKLYPGPVGQLLAQEINAWHDFGYRLGKSRLILELVDHVMKTPLPSADGTNTAA